MLLELFKLYFWCTCYRKVYEVVATMNHGTRVLIYMLGTEKFENLITRDAFNLLSLLTS